MDHAAAELPVVGTSSTKSTLLEVLPRIQVCRLVRLNSYYFEVEGLGVLLYYFVE